MRIQERFQLFAKGDVEYEAVVVFLIGSRGVVYGRVSWFDEDCACVLSDQSLRENVFNLSDIQSYSVVRKPGATE